jgi:hypothetical protein
MGPAMAPRVPMYPPGAPLGQQLFYGQPPPALMPQVFLLFSFCKCHLFSPLKTEMVNSVF